MIYKNIETAAFFCIALACAALSACAPQATLTLKPEGSARIDFQMTISPNAEKTLERFTGTGGDRGIFDVQAIQTSLALAGFKSASAEIAQNASLSLSIPAEKGQQYPGDAILVDHDKKTASLSLSRDNLSAVFAVFPPETLDFLELLMAPAFTGEELDRKEYVDIIASAYGKTVAGDLENSALSFTIRAPSPMTVTGSSPGLQYKKLNSAIVCTIPLVDLLVLSEPITLDIRW